MLLYLPLNNNINNYMKIVYIEYSIKLDKAVEQNKKYLRSIVQRFLRRLIRLHG